MPLNGAAAGCRCRALLSECGACFRAGLLVPLVLLQGTAVRVRCAL